MERPALITDTPEVIEKYGTSFEPKRENWEPITGRITFDDVTFRYPDGTENVLEHFSTFRPARPSRSSARRARANRRSSTLPAAFSSRPPAAF